jgi:signal peptide peptidase SppA
MKLLDILTAPWAIEPGKLLEIQAIYLAHARGEKADLAAIEARLGRPLANEPKPYTIDQGVAILPVEGVIAKRANMFMDISGGVSTELLGRDLQAALQDPQVHSIILAIDSPGGSVDGTQALASQIRAGAQQKPIVTLASGTIASAAYWLGSAGSAVYIADGTTISGSIGVVASHTDYSKARAERGITVTEITAGKYKRIASDNAPLTKEGKQYLQDQVDYYYSLFVNAVADHRGTTAERVLADMADGRVWIGQQGIDAGLIDAVQTMPQLVAALNADYAASLADRTYERGANLPRAKRSRLTVDLFALQGNKTAAPKATIPPISQGATHMNREQLAAEHPALVDSILAEGRAAGAAAERARILAIESAAIPGHDALVAKLKADGATSAGDAALQIMAAEKQLRVQADAQRQSEAPAPLVLVPKATVSPTVEQAEAQAQAALAGASVEDRCKATWDKDAAVRAEFGSLSAFTAYTNASERGAVKLLTKKPA